MAAQGGSGQGAGGAAPAHVAAATSRTGQTITVAAAMTNGGLKGTPPPMFDGDRDKSHKFLVDFRIYKFTNRNNDAMSNPATRVTTALTYMGGPLVDPWKEQQMEELQRRITRGAADTDERHWTTFEQAFKDTFYNVNIKAEAYQKLENLKMKDNLDYFISEFKRLVTASEIDINSHGIIPAPIVLPHVSLERVTCRMTPHALSARSIDVTLTKQAPLQMKSLTEI